jgi:hypothetical protein
LLSRADDDDKDDSGKDALLVVVALLAASRNVDASIFSVVGDSFFSIFPFFFLFREKIFALSKNSLQKINSPYLILITYSSLSKNNRRKF